MIIDEFPTVQSAAEFGNRKAKTLLHEQNAGYLILTDVTGSHYRIEQEQIIVSRLKQEGRGKLVVDANDFEVNDIKISDFSSTEGLDKGFESLAYAVKDSNGRVVQ